MKAVGATGNEVTVNAKAVILATGGFGANLDMVAELVPALKGFMTTNAAGAQGQGIKMAQALGAADGLLVRNIVLFSVLIYELVGPLLTKEALTAAGEITAKPKEVLERRAKALAEAEPKEFLEEREAKKHKKQDL